MLKLARWKDSFLALKQLLLVFLVLVPNSIYTRAITVYILLLHQWKQYFPQVATIWENHLSAFVEEDGELSFSVLSRTVLADSTKSSFKTINKAYLGQSLYHDAMAELDKDLQSFTRTASLHVILSDESAEVEKLVDFLNYHIQSIRQGNLRIYPTLKEGVKFYEAPSTVEHSDYRISLNLALLAEQPDLELSIKNYEPPNLPQQLEEVLNSIETTLLVDNASGCEIRYLLYPQELEIVSNSSSEEELEEEWFPN